MKQVGAVGAAVLMVLLALVVRNRIDEKDTPGRRLTIACITELADACNTLTNVDVRIEDAATTLTAITAHTAKIDGWVTFEPWPQMAGLQGQPTRVAASPLTVAMVKERADALAKRCALGWKCLGDIAGQQWVDVGGNAQWGLVKIGLPAPSTALGALLLANAASGYFGNTTFGTNDFDSDFILWKSRVTAAPGSFTQFIQQFPAAFSAVGALQVDVESAGTTRPVTALQQNPEASAVVVVADVNGHVSLKNDLARALRGWGAPADNAGLPSPGVLLALAGLTG